MAKMAIDDDEWYPVYLLVIPHDTYYNHVFDIPEDKVEWIEKTFDEFDKCQKYLENLREEQLKKDKEMQ